MSNVNVKNELTTAKKKPPQFVTILNQSIDEIGRALPAHLSKDRMARIALTAFRRNPKLEKCDPRSVLAAVIQAAQLGLEPDTLGRAYLVPYKTECTFIPGWKGLVELANRSGQCAVWTGAVFEGDIFSYALGDKPYINHQPGGEYDPAKITHVYACGQLKNSDLIVREVWPISRVWKHRDRFNKVGQDHYSYKHPEMYARKVVLLQVLKYMPSSPEINQAIEFANTAESGLGQNLTVDQAIEGTWTADNADENLQHEEGADQSRAQEMADRVSTTTKDKPVTTGAPSVTYAELRSMLEKAPDVDAIDTAADLISAIKDEQQRSELREIYQVRKDKLIADSQKI